MWNYRQLTRLESPMNEILSRCSSKSNIRLVIYHLSENHVECATTPDMAHLSLGDTARAIKADSRHNHAILALDIRTNDVYKIEDVPELPVASAVLLCVVTELLNGVVLPRENEDGAPTLARGARPMPISQNIARGANGRFVKQSPCIEEQKTPIGPTRVIDEGAPLCGHRFRLGRR